VSTIAPVASLLIATALLFLGSGLLGVLVPTRAVIEGYPTLAIGLLGTAYYAGFVAGCARVPALIARVGHIRSFAALAALGAAAVLGLELLVWLPAWMALRVALGFCFAGLYALIESWLNDRATNGTRGRILGAYMTTNLGASLGGKLLLMVGHPGDFPLFALAGIAVCLSLVPVALSRSGGPTVPPHPQLDLRALYRRTPVAVIGCLGAGLANGAFWTLGPVFAGASLGRTEGVVLFMGLVALGGALVQWPLGQLSDKADRRKVIGLAAVLGTAAAAGLVLASEAGDRSVLALGLAFGAAALPLYALCIAHTDDLIDPSEFVDAGSALLMAFGIGAVFGPPLASGLVAGFGQGGLFLFTAGVHGLLAVFIACRLIRRPPAPEAVRGPFVALPRTTQAVLALHPSAGGRA
jgi:MFS family permease